MPYKVECTDEKMLNYLASKLYDQMRNLQTRPAKHVVNYRSIYLSLYWAANDHTLVVFKVDDHIIGTLAYTIITPWYTHHRCLEEMFVLCLEPSYHGFGRVALKFLKRAAMCLGCAIMETGASMTDQPEVLRNLYTKVGKCTFNYPSFVWLMPH